MPHSAKPSLPAQPIPRLAIEAARTRLAGFPILTLTPWLIHGGTASQNREKATVLPWHDLSPLLNQLV